MPKQQAALVGCKEGPWVNTSRMRSPRVRIKAAAGTRLVAEQREPEARMEVEHNQEIPVANWTRIVVEEGQCESVLCIIREG